MLHPVIVIPALNEADSLQATCRSLGFGRGRATRGSLVLVDNGSVDATLEAMERIATNTPGDAVTIVREASQGYVPARHAGALAAASWADRAGRERSKILLLQADADTVYEEGYVDAMTEAVREAGTGFLVSGVSIAPSPERDPCAAFRSLEAEVDGTVDMSTQGPDVVVDDKVAGFILSDYMAWGGHRREYVGRPPLDETFAETTRLFIAAHLGFAARRLDVEAAGATTSSRRILEDPALAFAMAGFPREASWRAGWRNRYSGPTDLVAFAPGAPRDEIALAVETRRRHLRALFEILPALVGRARKERTAPPGSPRGGSLPASLLMESFQLAGVG